MATPVHHRLVIIGSGPAGYTAAIYAARANLAPLLLEGDVPNLPGGQLMITTEVENYPGFPKGVTGPELMELFKAQAARFGTKLVTENATRVDLSTRPFRVWHDSGEVTADAIIVATGASARWLGIPSEQKLMNRGVSACATCDGSFFKQQEVAVVGGGDTAMEEALYLANLCSKVTVVHRRGELRASKIMADRAQRHPKIAFAWHQAVEEILGDKSVTGVRLKDARDGTLSTLAVTGVFIAIGHTPNTAVFAGQLATDENGYLALPGRTSATSVAGVFAAGDCADHVYRQAVTAAGTGCMAAIDAERFLSH
jgi:thioredoxin reductase (NADPH)